MGQSKIKYIKDPDGMMSVIPIRDNWSKPLQRYFPSDLAGLYDDGNMHRFKDYGDPKYKNIHELAKNYLHRFLKAEGTGLYLFSPNPGSGKTMLACLLAASLTRKYNITSQAINTVALMQKAQDVFSDERGTLEAILNPVKAVDVLVLDELGGEKYSEFREDLLYELINHRLNKAKPVFFTSNVDIDDLHYHPRIKSRITEMSFRISMPDKDMRIRVRKEKNQQIFKSFNE